MLERSLDLILLMHKQRTWSDEDILDLINGIEAVGGRKWTDISRIYFESKPIKRAPVELKDKWRYLVKLLEAGQVRSLSLAYLSIFYSSVLRMLGFHYQHRLQLFLLVSVLITSMRQFSRPLLW